ncbi:MAG TPA: phage Gp37/Gp68 family protein [Acetobacteraceae bacterium]|jgi:protein gp37|nr:phage Gp37/Gp68 family protein [Acetobacteraceae bacterium]
MAETTNIEWTGATWNPITGCSVCSPGCKHCYAMTLAGTRLQHHPSRAGLTQMTKAGPVWTGEVRFNEAWLDQPIRWSKPRDIFVCAHSDLFHESVPDEWIDRVFAVMALARQHRFQVLTKRTDRMRDYMTERWQPAAAQVIAGLSIPAETVGEGRCSQIRRECLPLLVKYGLCDPDKGKLWTPEGRCKAEQWKWPLSNVWLGTSVEDQTRADERRRALFQIAAEGWNTWVSYEPALGLVDWIGWEFIRWLVSGGESGTGARPSNPDWHRAARDFCCLNRIPFFFKQWGSWAAAEPYGDRCGHVVPAVALGWPEGPSDRYAWFDNCAFYKVGKKAAGAALDGREWKQMPE